MNAQGPMTGARFVIRHSSLVILWSLVIGHWSFAQAPLPPATVSFLDGSFLRGEIESLNSETLKWRHPNARQPIEFTTTNLNSIRMPARALALPTNSAPVVRVQLAGGDEFEGQLLSLDGESFEIETWFAGRLRGQRAGLASLAFYGTSQSALYDGPRAADEWKIGTGTAVANRMVFDPFGNNVNVMPAFRIVAPARAMVEPTPQEAVIQLKAEIARLGEKGSAVLRQALEKRLKEVEEAAAKVPANAVDPKAPAPNPPARVPIRALPVLPNRAAPPLAPALDPAAQTVKAELDRAVGKAAPGERPPAPPPNLNAGDAAPARVINKKPAAPEISTMASRARLAATVADYLKTDLVLLAVDAGLVKEATVKADLEKQVQAGSDLRTVIRREGALLTARLLRELEHLKNDPSAIALTRTYDLLGGVRAAAAAPVPVQPHTVAVIMKLVEAAQKAAAAGEFIKSDLVRAAVDADLASERALERWFEEYNDAVAVARDKAKEARFKALLKAESALMGTRLLQTLAPGAGFAEAGELAQQLAQAQADLGMGALVMAQANALAEARVRALGALQLNNLNVVGAANAEGVLAGRAAAANTNAAWTFRDGAYYGTGVGTIGRECNLPTKARIEFDMAWKGQPYFRFSFFTRSTDQFDYSDGWQFYSSSSGYIYSMRRSGAGATSSSGARVPQMVSKSTVRLTFLVNTETEITTMLADGEKVHEWKGMGSPGPGTGIVFYNYNASSRVRISDIRITPWDGRVDRDREPLGAPGADPDKLVEVPPPDTAVVEFVNQDRATGTLHGIRDGKLAFNPAGTKLEIPLTRAALIAFPVNAPPELLKVEGVQVTLHRNERLTLALEKWGPGEVTAVSPVFGRLTLKPESIRALRFNPSAPRGPVDEWGGP
ncbi:MAG: hypothetical protein ABMA26_11975 [Limisphaerales bacterium]